MKYPKTLTVKVSGDHLGMLDKFQKKSKLNRSSAIRLLIENL